MIHWCRLPFILVTLSTYGDYLITAHCSHLLPFRSHALLLLQTSLFLHVEIGVTGLDCQCSWQGS